MTRSLAQAVIDIPREQIIKAETLGASPGNGAAGRAAADLAAPGHRHAPRPGAGLDLPDLGRGDRLDRRPRLPHLPGAPLSRDGHHHALCRCGSPCSPTCSTGCSMPSPAAPSAGRISRETACELRRGPRRRASATTGRRSWSASTSTSPRAPSSPSSARPAAASRPSCACCSARRRPTRGAITHRRRADPRPADARPRHRLPALFGLPAPDR